MLVFCTVEMNTSARPEASAIEQHTSKGKILLREAYSCKDDTKFVAAIEEYKLALNHAFLFKTEITPCLLNLGAAQISAGQHAEGSSVLDLLLDDSHYVKEIHSNSLLHGHVLYHLGLAHSMSNQPKKAMSMFEKAIREYRKEDNTKVYMCETMLELAELHLALNDNQQAFALFDEAADRFCNECNQLEKSCKAILRQVDILLKSNPAFAVDRIKTLLQNCLSRSSQIDDLLIKCEIKMKVASKYSSLGEHREALNCYDSLIGKLQQNDQTSQGKKFQELKATSLQQMAGIFADQENYEGSCELATSAADLFGKLGKRNAQGKSFFLFAENQRKQNKYGKSYQSYLHALQAYKDSDDTEGQWSTYESMGDICMMKNYFERAAHLYQLAYKIQACGDEKSDHLIEKLSLALKQDAYVSPNSTILMSRPSLDNLQLSKSNSNKSIVVEPQLKSSLKDSPTRPKSSLGGHLATSSSSSSSDDDTPKDVKAKLKKVVEKLNRENTPEGSGKKKKTKFEQDEHDSLSETSIDLSVSSSNSSSPSRVRVHPRKAGRRDEVPMRYANRGLSAFANHSDDTDTTSSTSKDGVEKSKIPFITSESEDDREGGTNSAKEEASISRTIRDGGAIVAGAAGIPVQTDEEEAVYASLPLTNVTPELQEDDEESNYLSDTSSSFRQSTSGEDSSNPEQPPPLPARNGYDKEAEARAIRKARKKRKEREKRRNKSSKACTIM